jgi:Ni/Co efflux regulator RcnB
MISRKWMMACATAVFFFSGRAALAQENGEGHGHGKGHEKHDHDRDDNEEHGEHHYDGHDREMRQWYSEHRNNLPPGLAKRDRLPPGLERQLVVRGTLPPGLQRKILPVPQDLDRCLPPPPPDCRHVVIGGHIVLLNARTNLVVDIFHFELN